MRGTGLADRCLLMPELEFFIFDDVRFDQREFEAFYHVNSRESAWNRGRVEHPNLGYKPGSGLGYFPCPPTDSLVNLRSEMAQRMAECGIATSAHFHEVATGGQCEIDLSHQDLVVSADQVMTARYIIRNVARNAGKTATFMPKPLFGDNGSGMHTHLTLWKDDESLFSGHGYAGLSDLGLHAVGGLIKHAPALCAFANPTTNSYKRQEAGQLTAITRRSFASRSASPATKAGPSNIAARTAPRTPTCSTRPCSWRFSMASRTRSALANLWTRTSTTFSPTTWTRFPPPPAPSTVRLRRFAPIMIFSCGEVFTPDVIDTWIWFKQTYEIEALRIRPHPYEFSLYYDV